MAKVSGSRTYAIKNDLAKLELAIHMMVLDKLRDNGFTVITVPALSKEKPLYGQGYLPFSRDEIYYMPADDLYLSGTAELILNSLRADEIIPENELPILYAGFSPCFRREAGAAGKDTRGTFSENKKTENRSEDRGRDERAFRIARALTPE